MYIVILVMLLLCYFKTNISLILKLGSNIFKISLTEGDLCFKSFYNLAF